MNERRTEGLGHGGGPGRAVRNDGATEDGGNDSAVQSGRGILAASAGVGWTTLRRSAAAALNDSRAPRESLQPLAPQGLRGSARP